MSRLTAKSGLPWIRLEQIMLHLSLFISLKGYLKKQCLTIYKTRPVLFVLTVRLDVVQQGVMNQYSSGKAYQNYTGNCELYHTVFLPDNYGDPRGLAELNNKQD